VVARSHDQGSPDGLRQLPFVVVGDKGGADSARKSTWVLRIRIELFSYCTKEKPAAAQRFRPVCEVLLPCRQGNRYASL
jgi:hypothetical protein